MIQATVSSMDMSLSKLWETVKDSKAWHAAMKRREVKDKGEKERYTHLNAEFLFSLAFPFSSFHSYLSGFLKQPFCFFAFIFLGSWRRVLIKYDPLEEGMANHPSILAMRTT